MQVKKRKNKLFPGLIVEMAYPLAYPSGFFEYTKLIRLEDVTFSYEYWRSPPRIQKMWLVEIWDKLTHRWQGGVHHIAIPVLEKCRVVSPLERLLVFKSVE